MLSGVMPYTGDPTLDRSGVINRSRHLLPGAVLFAGLAGYVNTVALDYFATPVSHMSGAISHLGANLGEGRMADALASLGIIGGFLAGAIAAGATIGAIHLGPGRRYGWTLLVEAGLIAWGATLLGHGTRAGLPLLAMACGLQNAMTSSYCGLAIRTTHVTGTVTDMGVMLGHWIRHRAVDGYKLRLIFGVTLAFGIGGVGGAMAVLHWGPRCLVAGVGFCLGAAALMFRWSRQGWLRRDLERV